MEVRPRDEDRIHGAVARRPEPEPPSEGTRKGLDGEILLLLLVQIGTADLCCFAAAQRIRAGAGNTSRRRVG